MNQFESPFFQELETLTGPGNEFELNPEFEFANEYASNSNELLPEFETEFGQQELEGGLTQELMAVQSEAELFDWMKKAAKKVAGAGSQLFDSPAGRQATAALTNIAQKTLRRGGHAVNQAAQSAADRIPSFVRFATDTIRDLANEVRAGNPHPAVRSAIIRAAARHYPFILRNAAAATPLRRPQPLFTPEDSSDANGTEQEYFGEFETNLEGSFNEVTEMELASELLAVQNEAELDQFLGRLIKKAAGAVSNFARSGAGKALGGVLKGLAKKALPIAGGAIGSFIAPGVGTAIGSKLGAMAGNLFELELEGLSAEDREFEVSRAFVRFAGNAARRAARMGRMNPNTAARTAIMNAARRYAPGLLVQNNSYAPGWGNNGNGGFFDAPAEDVQTGSWYRQGNQVIIQGLYQ